MTNPTALPAPEWRVSPNLTDYDTAHAEMEARARAIRGGAARELIWCLEHPPVYTGGTAADEANLLDAGDALVRRVGRGGDWTWHGPGQRVCYVMLDVAARGHDVRRFVRQVEEWVILTLADFGVATARRDGLPGVWCMRGGDTPPDKIAAVGIRLTGWVSWHGLAINVNPDLDAFAGIVPCGVRTGGVTSLHREGVRIDMAELDRALRESFGKVFG